MPQAPTVGRIVQYTLTEHDAKLINQRRRDFAAYKKDHTDPAEPGQPGATGHIGAEGNYATMGDVCAATVVRVFDESAHTANLQVHLDGTDTYWATSRAEAPDTTAGSWHWPPRA